MAEYTYTTTETTEEHAEREGVDMTTEERAWCTTCNTEAQASCAAHKTAIKVEQQILVCSCGWGTCPLIVRYGHPVPVYVFEIEPIPSQMERDRVALALRAARIEVAS